MCACVSVHVRMCVYVCVCARALLLRCSCCSESLHTHTQLTHLNTSESRAFCTSEPQHTRMLHTYIRPQTRYARLGQMVAFARAMSDGVFSATVWDVAVLPSWQKYGLGRAMMERLTAKLVKDGIPTIALVRVWKRVCV